MTIIIVGRNLEHRFIITKYVVWWYLQEIDIDHNCCTSLNIITFRMNIGPINWFDEIKPDLLDYILKLIHYILEEISWCHI